MSVLSSNLTALAAVDALPEPRTISTAGNPSNRDIDFADALSQKLASAMALKDYAVSNNLKIDAKDIENLNAIYGKVSNCISSDSTRPISTGSVLNTDDLSTLDKVICNITRSTYPLTINNVSDGTYIQSQIPRDFRVLLMAGGVIGVAGAITCVLGLNYDWWPIFLTSSLLAVCFGFLGSVVYSFFNCLRIAPVTNFNDYDRYDHYARLVLGILLGWVFYFAFVQSDFTAIAHHGDVSAQSRLEILLPFLAGYSTTLVVTLLNKIIGAVQLTLGIDNGSGRDSAQGATASQGTASTAGSSAGA